MALCCDTGKMWLPLAIEFMLYAAIERVAYGSCDE